MKEEIKFQNNIIIIIIIMKMAIEKRTIRREIQNHVTHVNDVGGAGGWGVGRGFGFTYLSSYDFRLVVIKKRTQITARGLRLKKIEIERKERANITNFTFILQQKRRSVSTLRLFIKSPDNWV